MKKKERRVNRWVLIASASFLVLVLLFTSYYYLFLKSHTNSNNQSDKFIVNGGNETNQLNNGNFDNSNNTANNNGNFDNKGEESSNVPAVEQGKAITLYEQGNNLYSQKKPEEAIVYYNRAIQANPYYPVIYNKKAQVLYELNRKNEAIDTLLEGLENNPDDPQLLSTYEIINAK